MFLYITTTKNTTATAAKEFWFDAKGLHFLDITNQRQLIPRSQILEFSVADFKNNKDCYQLQQIEVSCEGARNKTPDQRLIPMVTNLNNGTFLPAWLAKKPGWVTIKITNRFIRWIITTIFA